MIRSVLIVGGSGFLGTHIAQRLRDGYKVFITYHSHPITIPGVTCLPMNIENRTWVKSVIQMSRPDYIVYVPGPSPYMRKGYDFTELEKIFSKGAATLLSIAEMIQPKFIYLSNSEVFDGERGNYHEGESAIPHNAYGKAKISGENLIRGRSMNSIIIRCSPVFGRGNGLNTSFLDRIRTHLDQGKTIELPANEIHSFAPVEGLADMIGEIIAHPTIRNRSFHYGGLTKMTWADFGKAFARRFGYDPRLIIPTNPAREPTGNSTRTDRRDSGEKFKDYSLNSTQSVELLKIKPLLLQESFDLIEKKLIIAS
jgi:dTDP-4-dehydrorhamnose reductase